MAIQATVVLDSGVLLLEGLKEPYTSIKVGYFQPRIVIYVDGEEASSYEPAQIGKILDVRLEGGITRKQIVPFSNCMGSKLLRLSQLYDGKTPPKLLPGSFETIISFDSGHFRCSGVKERNFYEMLGGQKIGSKKFGPIAHDIVIEFDLGDDGVLSLKDGGGLDLYSSRTARAKRRVDIEILAEDRTAEMFYAKALDLDPKESYFLPNQGHPPPVGAP
ncbi:MAG TPA: hypothetical protein VNH22_17475 [Blastocatellia bacterium]|jgi:hypothetical protein|nr:hypothetical protein [Blastocatellia bacterium]